MKNQRLRTRPARRTLRLRARIDTGGDVDVDVDVVAIGPGRAAPRSRDRSARDRSARDRSARDRSARGRSAQPAKRVRRPSGKTRPRTTRSPGAGRSGPGRCILLFIAANPDGSLRLRLAEECAEIRRELMRTLHRDELHFEARDAASIDDLLRELDALAPTVLHISGHGDRDGLVLQDEGGQPQPLSPRALAMILGALARAPRVIVLNVCDSAAYADVLRRRADCVVCIDGAIQDTAARVLATRLYGAIGNGRSIGTAVEQGIAAITAHELPGELLPRCVTRDGVDAFRLVLVGRR